MQEPSVQEATAATGYKDTLNLPQTAFKMKAGAATREVEIENAWEENHVYEAMMASRDRSRRFLLHDGPPYLSSDKIHIGTALNKILKDVVIRYKAQHGYYAPYVPGYDGHGLPIENAVVKSLKGGRHSISPAELRKRCRAFAMDNLKGQETNFRRLGVWGDWNHPYVTIDPVFEATQVQVFGRMYQDGYIYKGFKPVYWCSQCETALAEAEVEYADHVSPSVYVKFPLDAASLEQSTLPDTVKSALHGASLVIWTTTPWTLPANLALSVNPTFEYRIRETREHGKLVLAADLLDTFAEDAGLREEWTTDHAENQSFISLSGQELAGLLARHPFIDRFSKVLTGEHVTRDAGTGIVHTAPGHGMDDYLVCQEHDRVNPNHKLGIISPLDNSGRFTAAAETPGLSGVFYEKANEPILELLRERGALVHQARLSHSYPHCWRCHKPVIYRATEQWFIDIDRFRDKALAAVDAVEWLPERGRNRIYSMIESRGDWCLSRQRVWGVPIPVFYCRNPLAPTSDSDSTGETCNAVLCSPQVIEHLYHLFCEHSSDLWWEQSAEELLSGLPESQRTCPKCGGQQFEKEMDIMDVWFDSGVTHTAVVEARKDELGELPAELYLEGSDQHRGWFQSSLLTSVMLRGKAPYKSVLTHGFVLDEAGRKMSKSLGNVVDPGSVIREYGADVLRLWVASVDYANDVRIGKNTLYQMAEIYKKVRNTIRFVLGNLYDFHPEQHRVPEEALSPLDRYTLHRLRHIIGNITQAFDTWELHRYCHEIQYLCMADLSALYFDVVKDMLYCDAKNAPRRRAIQTVLYDILSGVLPVLAPVMPHLADDIWLSLPEHHRMRIPGDTSNIPPSAIPLSATMLPWPHANGLQPDSQPTLQLIEDFEHLKALRKLVNEVLEIQRQEKTEIGSSLEAALQIFPISEVGDRLLKQAGYDVEFLKSFLIVSAVQIFPLKESGSLGLNEPPITTSGVPAKENEHFGVISTLAAGIKCQRCWKYEVMPEPRTSGPNDLCRRCREAVSAH